MCLLGGLVGGGRSRKGWRGVRRSEEEWGGMGGGGEGEVRYALGLERLALWPRAALEMSSGEEPSIVLERELVGVVGLVELGCLRDGLGGKVLRVGGWLWMYSRITPLFAFALSHQLLWIH